MTWYSPLFRVAGTAVLEAARREFAASTAGRLFGEVEMRRASTAPDRMRRTLEQYSRFGPREALRELRGTGFGQFARQIERYSRGDAGMKRLLNQFLNELGPAGRLIRALSGPSGRGEIDKLVSILQAFGFEVLPPRAARRRGDPITERGISAATEMLESMGARVTWPEAGRPERPAGRMPFGVPAYGEGAAAGVSMPMADGPPRRFGTDHPIVTGEMLPAVSSNVHSYGYDIESTYLYVRFLGHVRGSAARAGPGPLYRYRDVTPEEFLTLMAADSKGSWVWDNLRIRGTVSGHQKDYELVGVTGGYVPRKATVRVDPMTGGLQEWFIRRRVRDISGGGWLESPLPSEVAAWGRVDRGEPDRGMPDRGEPYRG